MDTSGFYKEEELTLLYAPNFVYMPDKTTLTRETRAEHEYPVKGWYWFDSETDARNFFNLPITISEE